MVFLLTNPDKAKNICQLSNAVYIFKSPTTVKFIQSAIMLNLKK